MELIRNNNGFFDISELRSSNNNFSSFWIEYEGIKYYYKKREAIPEDIYNELIAEELAKDFCIPCAHYDLAICDGKIGVISENFIDENDNYFPINRILREYYKDEVQIDIQNNLQDIWEAIEYRYNDTQIVQKLLNQLVDIFMFDILIGNIDRHVGNLGIIEKDSDVNFAPLFDNEKILSSSIYHGGYSLGIDGSDFHFNRYVLNSDNNFLSKFLEISSSEYKEYFENRIWIISDKNIEKVLERVENRICSKIDDSIKKKIKQKFQINRNMINDVLKQTNQRKLG